MTPSEKAVLDELELFRREANDCTTCLYAYLTIHAVGGQMSRVHRQLNEHALFWNTTLRALQTALLIALGRVFDSSSRHNITILVRKMEANRTVFSRKALRIRKQAIFADAAGLQEYMRDVVAPHAGDFRRIARLVELRRATYHRVYKALRDKVFAHLVLTDSKHVQKLFSQTNIRELERLTTFLGRLHDAYLETFHNGRRLAVRPSRYAVGRIIRSPKGARAVKSVHEEIIAHTRSVLLSLGTDNAGMP